MAAAAHSAAEEPIPEPTGIWLTDTMSMAWRRLRVRCLRWACLRKSRRSPFMVFQLERRMATVILWSTASVIAGLP